MKKISVSFLLVILSLAFSCVASAESMLTWDASHGEVDGYIIFYGTNQGEYIYSQDVGNVTQYSLFNLPLQENTTYYFIVKAYNEAGESSASNVTQWTMADTTPPFPPEIITSEVSSAGDVVLTWDANTELDLKEYMVYCGTSSGIYDPPLPAGNATSYTVTGLEEGETYYFSITAVDNSGNESGNSYEVVKTIPDITSPVVTILTPTDNSSYYSDVSNITITGNASDNSGLTQIAWTNDRGGNGIANGTEAWSVSSIPLQEGQNIITITALDSAGNRASSTLTVVYSPIDSISPTIAIISPTSTSTYETNNSVVNLSGTASDNSGVTQIAWTNDRGGDGLASGTETWSVSGIPLSEGDNFITVTAVDSAGNQGESILMVKYTLPGDTTPPAVSITSPTSKESYKTKYSSVDLSGNAYDDNLITQVTWSSSNGGSGSASGTTDWSASGITLIPGENTITIWATDTAGNTGWAQLSIVCQGAKK